MAEPFMGQIILGAFNFAPRNYATCNGQLVSITQNTTLFSLMGTTYGGDGRTTFALPDLRGRVPVHQGQGPGLTSRIMGEAAGEQNHTLINTEMPIHNHTLNAFNNTGDMPTAQGNILAGASTETIFTNVAPNTMMNPQSIGLAGGSQPHNNMQPYLVINFCIALQGIFPSRN